jgi:phage terminase large subunit-like protein
MWPDFQDAAHNLRTAEKLEEVERYIRTEGKEGIGRLIICKPPRYGKSIDAARLFPAWMLGRNPDKRIAITSYAATLSDGHSRAVRNYVQSQRFSNLFGAQSTVDVPVSLSDDSASVSDWDLAEPHQGGCVSRGVGGGLSGKGAHLLIIDDPTQDIETAASESHQRKLRDWYESVAYQRLERGGAIVIIQTRWNPDDLVGQLLKKMGSDDPDADQWEVVFEPALALDEDQYPKTADEFRENLLRGVYIPMGGDQLGRQPGEPLWAAKFPISAIHRQMANMSPNVFAALHEQLPRAISGGYFDEADLQIIEPAQVPEDLNWCAYVDLALGNTKKSDRNAVMPCTLNPDTGDLIFRDLILERELNRFLMRLKIAMLEPVNKKVIWGIEAVAFQTLVFEDFRKDATLTSIKMVKIIPTESKEDRAMGVSLRAKDGHVKLVRGSWNAAAIRELLDFPYGQHDDVVDTVSGGPYMIAKYGKKRESKIL